MRHSLLLYDTNKVLRHLEATISYPVPEVEVLASLVILQWNITDDTEGYKRFLVDVADLCYGATLHIDSCCRWELIKDLLHLLSCIRH